MCVFLSGVGDFTVVMQGLLTYLCTFLGHNISNYLLIIALHHLRLRILFGISLAGFQGQTLFTHLFLTIFPYISTLTLGCRAPV